MAKNAKSATGRIYIGVGGWTYEPWRGTFYPEKLAQKRELEYAASQLTSIEINGTYHSLQKPASFTRWHDETPDGFMFAVKGSRYVTNRRVLAEAGDALDRFFASGVALLKDKLGPISWQFMPTKKFDSEDFEAFLELLPKRLEGRPLRHAVEVRHDSFKVPAFVELARKHGVGIVVAGDSKYPQIADPTVPFVYARIMGTAETEKLGYPKKALDAWAGRAGAWAAGKAPAGLDTVGPNKADGKLRDVFLYVISGHKAVNPATAAALIARVG